MSLVQVQLYWLERDETPGFEAVCDVFSGFGASAVDALDALAAAIEAGPPKPDPSLASSVLVEAPSGAVDLDKLADLLYQRMKADQVAATEPPTPATPSSQSTLSTTPPATPATPSQGPAAS